MSKEAYIYHKKLTKEIYTYEKNPTKETLKIESDTHVKRDQYWWQETYEETYKYGKRP